MVGTLALCPPYDRAHHALRIPQPRAGIGAEHRNPVDGKHHRKGDHQHRYPQHRNGGEIAALVEVVDQDRDHFGLRREQYNCRRQFAHHANEDETPGRDHAGAQQWRGDLQQRSQPRRAEDAACILKLRMDGSKSRLQLLIG